MRDLSALHGGFAADIVDLEFVSVFRGSIEFGTVLVDSGPAVSTIIVQATGQVTTDNTYTLARARAAATPMPVPGSMTIAATGLAALLAFRRRTSNSGARRSRRHR